MAQPAPPARRTRLRTERARSPRIAVPADARVRSWLAVDYQGFDDDSSPHGDFVIPATVTIPLVIKVEDSPLRPPVFVNGPSDTYTRVEGTCAPAYLEVHLAPLGAYRVLGPAVSEIGASIVGLEEITGADARWLSEQIQTARTWEERGRLLDEFLFDRGAGGPQPSPEVSQAWNLLVRSAGSTTIREIAREVGWSHKHLITKFKQQIGMTPRLAARLVRLSKVWRHIDDTEAWARIAAECGYADQAHLIREFRLFTGATPSALLTA